MKFNITLLLSIIYCCSFLSCKDKGIQQETSTTQVTLKAFKIASEKQKQNPNLKSRLTFWNKQLANTKFNTDSVLLSKIHYNIAGVFYAMNELDSIKKHMQIAWELMEKQVGYDEDKVQLYSGLGNIANMEQKLHQSNYYYNRAAQMLMADTALKLTPKQKINIYFAAAQSSTQLRQFDNAFVMNRNAMAILPLLSPNIKEKFRAYSQMASFYYKSKRSLDSLYGYIQKMEKLYSKQPNETDKRFIFDRKVLYFANINQKDSMFIYSQKRLLMDINDAEENGLMATSIITGNLFTSYNGMARIYIDAKQLDSAKFYLTKCQLFAKKYTDKIDDERLILYEENQLDYLFATKKYAAAENLQNVLLERTQLLYESENARAIAEMGTLFQLQAKDKSIHNLSETILLSQTKLQQNRLWLAISTLAFLLAISVALLLYVIQRQRKLKAETEKTQLEQRLLRTQMEPHFIFNTLSALQSFIRFNDNEKALVYLHKFGRLLRSSLQLSRESSVKLSEEIEVLQNYLSLQQMRYDNAFGYQINIDEAQDIDSIYLPPMLIQPFVENAILHGINPNGKNGVVSVDFNIEGELLLVTVKDNGNGISNVIKPASHKPIATTISKERLASVAKESGLAAGIDIKSNKLAGTTVIITIPIKCM